MHSLYFLICRLPPEPEPSIRVSGHILWEHWDSNPCLARVLAPQICDTLRQLGHATTPPATSSVDSAVEHGPVGRGRSVCRVRAELPVDCRPLSRFSCSTVMMLSHPGPRTRLCRQGLGGYGNSYSAGGNNNVSCPWMIGRSVLTTIVWTAYPYKSAAQPSPQIRYSSSLEAGSPRPGVVADRFNNHSDLI